MAWRSDEQLSVSHHRKAKNNGGGGGGQHLKNSSLKASSQGRNSWEEKEGVTDWRSLVALAATNEK